MVEMKDAMDLTKALNWVPQMVPNWVALAVRMVRTKEVALLAAMLTYQ